MENWDNFLVAQVGASAALLGLLFVGVSLNLTKILSISYLPDRSLAAMVLLFAILLVSSLLLIPDQPAMVVGLEVLGVGVAVWLSSTVLAVRGWQALSKDRKANFFFNFVFLQAATLPYIVAGLMLLAAELAGMYWLSAAIVVSLAKALTDAWVLLIEINR